MEQCESMSLQEIENCRDIGGIQRMGGVVRTKKLIRSAQLYKLTEFQMQQLKNYGVYKMIDLRGIKEREAAPDPVTDFAQNIHIPIFDDMRIPVLNEGFMKDIFPKLQLMEEIIWKQEQRMLQVYRNFVTEKQAIEGYKKIFKILLENDTPGCSILFHCTAGKDRTGFVIALILSALGVPWQQIMEDYLKTNQSLSNKARKLISKAKQAGINDNTIQKARTYFAAREEYLETSFNLITNTYGSTDTFLYNQLEMTESQRIKLYDIYTQSR